MKKTRITFFVALALCLAMVMSTPLSVFAAETSGEIGFGTVDAGEKPVNPDDPNPKDPEGEKPDPGDEKPEVIDGYLSLDHVPKMNFGASLKVDQENSKDYNSVITSVTLGKGGNYDAPFIQVSDKRGGGLNNGWKVTVKSGAFVENGGRDGKTATIDGAKILFNAGGAAQTLATGSTGGAVGTGEINCLATGANELKVFSGTDKSIGTWVNRLYTGTASIRDDNNVVQLRVPANKAAPGKSYEAKLTWIIATTPV